MVTFRFRCSSKREFAFSDLVEVMFSATQQAPFGKSTPQVNFVMHMTADTAAMFDLGEEYMFNAYHPDTTQRHGLVR